MPVVEASDLGAWVETGELRTLAPEDGSVCSDNTSRRVKSEAPTPTARE